MEKHFFCKAPKVILLFFIVYAFLCFATSATGEKLETSGNLKNKTNSHIDPATGIKFIHVKGGCYQMGDIWGDGSKDEKPPHTVCVDGFFIGIYEVTQGQWEKVMSTNPSKFREGADYPVENITWDEAQQFITKLNSMSNNQYRLPTEAEWEFAARAGGRRLKFATVTGSISHNNCNFDEKGGRDIWTRTSPVGSLPANLLGTFDMCGNVWEWVQDSYDFNAYSKHKKNNPLIVKKDSDRVIRGCGWSDDEEDCRVSYRDKIPQDCPVCSRRNDIGLRLLMEDSISGQ